MLLTKALVIHYALTCGHVDPGVADAMADIVVAENSSFNTTAIGKPNRDGSRDFGLYQINEKNFAKLGLTYTTVMDPCEASRAAATWWCVFSVYNTGNCRDGFLNGYVRRVVLNGHGQDHVTEPRPPPPAVTLASQFPTFGRKE